MKRYTVNVHYDAVVSVEVTAESEGEALEKARDEAAVMSLNEAEVVGTEACVTAEEDTELKEFYVTLEYDARKTVKVLAKDRVSALDAAMASEHSKVSSLEELDSFELIPDYASIEEA